MLPGQMKPVGIMVTGTDEARRYYVTGTGEALTFYVTGTDEFT